MRRSPLIAASALLVALGACGGSSSSGPTTVPPKADVVITAVEGIRWDAPTYAATATNGKVVVRGVNDSSVGHNLYIIAADGSTIPNHLDLPQRGKSATETVDLAPGTYTVICKIPGHSAMKSTLTVS